MARILKILLFLAIVAFIVLVVYAYFGDIEPAQTEIRQPVTLNADR